MFQALLETSIEQVDLVESFIQIHESLASQATGDRELHIKQYAVAACVTRLYAIYEHFIETIISDYLDALPELVPYVALPDALRTEYRLGISHLLGKLDSDRYGHLSHEAIVRSYHDAVTAEARYRFVTEALTRHEQNLRLPILESMLQRIDLKELRPWLSRSSAISALYEDNSALVSQLESELKNFVQMRNDSAHGHLDDLPSANVLQRYCTIVRALLRAVRAYVHKALVSQHAAAGKMVKLGDVTEVFLRPRAFVLPISVPFILAEGAELHAVSEGDCEVLVVQSLQLNGTAVESVQTEATVVEVGLRCQQIPRKSSAMYATPPLPVVAAPLVL